MGVHVAILAAYLAAGIAVNWTRAAYLTGHVLPTGRDAGLFVWDYWWVARSVLHLSNPWFSHYLAAPVGVPLGFHVLMPLPGLIMTPVTQAFGPSFSYNLLSAAAPGLMSYTMYRAARLWVPSQTGAIAGGAFYGLSTMMTWDSWFEIQLALGAICLPLALEAAVRLGRRPGWRQAVILGVVLGITLLTDLESSIMTGIVVVAALLPWLVRRAARGGPTAWVKLRLAGIAAAVTAVIASPQLIAMAQQALTGDASVPQSALAADYAHSGAARAADIRSLTAGRRVRAEEPGRVLLPLGAAQRDAGGLRRGADRRGPAGPGRLLAAAQRPAARPVLAGCHLARPGHRDYRRQPPVRAAAPGLARRAAVDDHAVHLDGPDLAAVLVPGSQPAHRTGAGGGRAAGRRPA